MNKITVQRKDGAPGITKISAGAIDLNFPGAGPWQIEERYFHFVEKYFEKKTTNQERILKEKDNGGQNE